MTRNIVFAGLLALTLGAASSCTVLEKLESAATNLQELVVDGKEIVTASKSDITRARAAADTDGDGKTSFLEWLLYLTSGGGLLTVLAGLARNGKSNERKSRNEAEVAGLKKDLQKLEEREAARIRAAEAAAAPMRTITTV